MADIEDVLVTTIALSKTEQMEIFVTDPTAYGVFTKIQDGTTYNFNLLDSMLGSNPKTIVDIGANIGGFSLFAARRWPGSTTFAFEPGRRAYQCLTRNLSKTAGARCFDFGLARGNHQLMLHGHDYGSVCSSVGEAGINNPGGEMIEIRDAGHAMRELGVTAIDILKIDTEGCEVPILRSMEALLPKAKAVLIEYHKEDDRRTIDSIFAPTHYLCKAKVEAPHRGELSFISREIIGAMDNIRIDLPLALAG